MSNAGKKLFNWKKEYPEMRVALGYLGRSGWSSITAAEFILQSQELKRIRRHYRMETGRELTPQIVLSRMSHHEELNWFEENMTWSYETGLKQGKSFTEMLQRAGIEK